MSLQDGGTSTDLAKVRELSDNAWDIGIVSGVLQGIALTSTLLPNQREAITDARKAIKRIEERNQRLVVKVANEKSSAMSQMHGYNEVRLLREGKVWHVWIDGEHVCECCDFTFEAAIGRLKTRLSPNKVQT